MSEQPSAARRLTALGVVRAPGTISGSPYWRMLVGCLLVALLFGGATSFPVRAGPASFCQDSESPAFRGGLADLKRQLGQPMGQAIECIHQDLATGDTLQTTSTGLAYVRAWDRLPTFTDG